LKTIHIFRAGKHTAANGATLDFSEEALQAAAEAYDPAKHEAPIVVGHPKDNGPAYGWVKTLSFQEPDLNALPIQVDPAFAEMVQSGRFKKVSASFYTPESPANPVPGVYYLRHVGFLGAQPPAIKGLKEAQFAEDEEGVVEFADAFTDSTVAGLFRRLREWIVDQGGIETADKVIPSFMVEDLEVEARRAFTPSDEPAPNFNELKEEHAMGPKKETAAKDPNADTSQDETKFAERERRLDAREIALNRREQGQFVDTLIQSGKVAPGHREGLVAFMTGLKESDVLEFSEGEETKKTSALTWLKGFLEAQPKQVDFAERSKTDDKPGPDLQDANAIADLALEYQESQRKIGKKITLTAAVDHVTRQSKV
jgi:hypothetical protein